MMGTSVGLWKVLVTLSKSQPKVHKKHRKQSYGDECSKSFNEREQAKLQWVQNMDHIIGDT